MQLMEAGIPLFDQISVQKNLPTLPHILLKLFEACSQDDVNLDDVAAIVSSDPSLSVNVLKLVNSDYFGQPVKIYEIKRALDLIGISGIKNMAICACVYEAFSKNMDCESFNLKSFWWHSLRCAFLAKNMAVDLNLSRPDEAFISGLLHDIGKIVLWTNFNGEYKDLLKEFQSDRHQVINEETRYGANHSEIATWLLNRWNFQSEISDPVRYHHETPARIAQALPMTQIVYIANFLSQDTEAKINEGIALAQKILGFSSSECIGFIEKSGLKAIDAANALGIGINFDELSVKSIDEKDRRIMDVLIQDVRNVSLLTVTLEGFLTAKDKSDFLTVISDGLRILAGIDHFIYFLLDAKRRVLFGYVKNMDGRYAKNQNLAVPMRLEQSLLVKSILGKTPLNYFRDEAQNSLPIIDEQVIDLLGGQGIYCLPIAAQGNSVGVLVLSIRKNDLPHLLRSEKLLKILIHKGALALQLDHLRQRQLNEVQFKRADASSDLARRVVHEVNNPLGIIKNYLKILEIKLSEGKMALDEIRIINEEISRVADVLKKLTDISQEKPLTQDLTDVNALLVDIVKITKKSLLEHSDIKLVTKFDRALPKVRTDKAGLKQVMLNLIKNAVEAMTAGGNLYLKTRHFAVPADSKGVIEKKDAAGYVEIQVIDEGPGMPDSIKEKLFDPYVSTKKGEHFGLGLSIAYNIVKSFQGSMTCESIPDKGTVFKIELPVRGY
jgi:nitrogen-specific signal transduction histidine kinase/HD-like signal output (HDOD) protein